MSEKVKGVENVRKLKKFGLHESIANVQEKATLAQFGIEYKDDSESSTGSSETDSDVDSADVELPPESIANFSLENMLAVLKTRQCNWFELVSTVEEMGIDPNCLESYYELVSSHFSEHELCLLQQSHAAYLHSEKYGARQQVREAAALNGDIVSESDSDNPDDYLPGVKQQLC